MSDEQWEMIRELLPRAKRGRPLALELREVLNAILYVLRTGIAWRYLPHEYPNYNSVYYHFNKWSKDGTWERINATLREQVRRRADRTSNPSAAILDSQSVKTTEAGGERGFDAHKKVKGRKRHLLTDTMGNLLKVLLTSAAVQDPDGGKQLLLRLPKHLWGRLQLILADGRYAGRPLARWLLKTFHTRLQTASRPKGAAGFVVLPKRWVVERTFAWLGRFRRLSKDYERLTSIGEGFIYLAAIQRSLRLLASPASS